jgi:hypothetical protein
MLDGFRQNPHSIGTADVFAVRGSEEKLCGVVLATTRNFELKA